MVDPTSTDLSLHPPDHHALSVPLFLPLFSLLLFFLSSPDPDPNPGGRPSGAAPAERGGRRSEAAAERGGCGARRGGSRRLRSEAAIAPIRDARAAARLGGGGIGSERRRGSLGTERWGGGRPAVGWSGGGWGGALATG